MDYKITIDPILKARGFSAKSEHEKSFELIKQFFDSQDKNHPNVLYLQNHIFITQARYHRLVKDIKAGLIEYKEYDKVFNQISDALFTFFNTVLYECEVINNKSEDEGIISHPNKVSGIIAFDLKLEDYSDEDILTLVNEIRQMLGLKEHEFKYLFTKSGSIIIGLEILRDYNLGVKLKSIVKVKWIDQIISFQIEDDLMEQYCLAFSELYLDLSNLYFLPKIITRRQEEFDRVEKLPPSYITILENANSNVANLYGVKLNGLDLRKLNLLGAILPKANLSEADLRWANLSEAYLPEANLSNSKLYGAKLIGIDLSNADLSVANLSDVDLSGANLSGVDLSRANLSRANLSGVNLHRANLSKAILSKADLTGVDLRLVDLFKTNLSDANLSDANLDGANLSGAK